MCLRVHEAGRFRDIVIGEGQMFLLPGNTPHNPIRRADTIGLVVERRRRPEEHVDRLRWYCDGCQQVVHEESFFVSDINNQLKAVIERYAGSEALRTCKACGHANSAK
jgi:3-hydroxyanthranilate 3,4-dioxygenase